MKHLVFIVLAFVMGTLVFAQAPMAFKYQAVARDQYGNVLANRSVSFRITILEGSMTGNIVYRETHNGKSTNGFGLVDLEIGKGAVISGAFLSINWNSGLYFLSVEMDPSGDTLFQPMGTTQLLSVPYALFSEKAGNGFSGIYNDLSGKPALSAVALTGKYGDLSDKPVTDGSETKVAAGANISVTGTGTSVNPYVVNSGLTHYPGELFGGGVVFYVDHTGQHGLVVSMIDVAIEKWSNVNDSLGIIGNNPWDGQTNTTAIISQPSHAASAAKICRDYVNANYGTGIFSDWYLPAIHQLSLLYANIYEVNKSLGKDGNSATTMIYYKPYWSSTENWNVFARGYACFFNFESGVIDKYSKSNPLVVRAIRSF